MYRVFVNSVSDMFNMTKSCLSSCHLGDKLDVYCVAEQLNFNIVDGMH
jgi:hypothetical protein